MPLKPLEGLEPLDDDDAQPQADEQAEPVAEEPEDELAAIDIDLEESDDGPRQEIRMFGKAVQHDEVWKRKPTVTGQGAIHCRTFHAKLREDALEFMDKQINEWLDSHPEYEVKLVTTAVGELRGKLVEPALFMTVWV